MCTNKNIKNRQNVGTEAEVPDALGTRPTKSSANHREAPPAKSKNAKETPEVPDFVTKQSSKDELLSFAFGLGLKLTSNNSREEIWNELLQLWMSLYDGRPPARIYAD
ncbi:hypothetical protein BC829DRAFT_422379 [Chytridium lagenaria]|nr:hypothetical protein BC829DRAFT_422379 [Chytridium lagenaria]